MALATRCPNCQSMFRVVSDQLKLRGGLVRCGSCRHVFDAISSLSYVDETAAGTAAARPPAPAAAARGASMPAAPLARERVAEPPLAPPADGTRAAAEREAKVAAHAAKDAQPETDAAAPPPRAAPPAPAERPDALAVPTLFAPNMPELDQPVADGAAGSADATDAGAAAATRATRIDVDAPRATVLAGAAVPETDDTPAEAPAFLRTGRQPAGFSIVFGGGSALLALLLVAQLLVVFRTELLTRWPQLRPQLVGLCSVFHCTVGWPTRAELLAVIGTELQAVPGTDILELTAVIRNRAAFRVSLPAVEVTLTDTQNRTLARKVFAPVDYLASTGEPSIRIDEGLGAGSDLVVRIVFEARGLNASGFVVYPFYL
jgi:predicted Zn finger-like uncharacterized protein